MPNRNKSHASPIIASQTAASLITDGSGSFGFFSRRVDGKARSSLRRKISSFCCLIRSGNRKRFLERTTSGLSFEFTGRLPRCVDDVEIASYQGHAAPSLYLARVK